ncbi:MAG TPA: FAD-dependent oxidoreductase [Vineibacter sp.]|nr:FAD-dependent oxidoreductase [Vineibacter sp.]
MTANKNVTVIGAGIVGVCCALYLQREGFTVRLIDRAEPGAGASAGNAGNLGIASCVPAALPGVLRKVPRMLFDDTAPLKLRWRHVPQALPWFVRFIAAAQPARVEAIADARNLLLSRLHEGLDPLVADAGAQALIAHSGLLMTFESEAAFAGAAYAIDLRRRRGVAMDILDGNEARQIEPALTPAIVRAIHVPRLAHTTDPLRLTQALARNVERNGGDIVRATVRGFETGPDGPRRILTDAGPLDVGRIVLAAGVWSRPLAAQLGTRVPLEAERGYHTMFADPPVNLRVALMSADRYIAVTPMTDGIRATGVAEFAAPDAPPDMENARRVGRHARALIPALTADPASTWMGPRPSHPDSKPVIGRSPQFANVFFAFGHDHIGLALAGITGKLIGELVAGRPTSIDLTPFRPDRF